MINLTPEKLYNILKEISKMTHAELLGYLLVSNGEKKEDKFGYPGSKYFVWVHFDGEAKKDKFFTSDGQVTNKWRRALCYRPKVFLETVKKTIALLDKSKIEVLYNQLSNLYEQYNLELLFSSSISKVDQCSILFFETFMIAIGLSPDKARETWNSNDKECKLVLSVSNYILPIPYIERQKEIQNLYQAFSTHGSYVQVISGTSGTGKTEFAYNFADVARKNGWFKHVIFTTYNTTLKDTIASLKTDGILPEVKDSFDVKVQLLKNLQEQGETLLVIDNYHNPIGFANELSKDCEAYKKLLDTKCHILLTTTTNLEKCYAIHVNEIESLPVQELIKLFHNIKGDNNDDLKTLEILIREYLLFNVYLVILSAELAKQGMSVNDIIDAFNNRTIDDTNLVSWIKDGKCQEDATMLEHFCKIMNDNKVLHPDKEKERNATYMVMTVLSALPVGGIKTADFYQLAFKDKKVAEVIIKRLQRHHLVFEKNGHIYIHPLVREYVSRKIPMREEYIHTYVSNLVQMLSTETYSDSFMYWLINGKEINSLLEKEFVKPNNEFSKSLQLLVAALCSYISSCYDIIKQTDMAYEYGVKAQDKLRKINWTNETEDNKLLIASCYNAIGYAVLHRKSDNKTQRKFDRDIAFELISKAEEVLQGVHNDRASIQLTKIHGNLGACYVDAEDYENALKTHTLAWKERETIIQKERSPEGLLLLATTYRCLGTDWFYLRKTKDPIECLKKSYAHNLQSLELFNSVYGDKHLETTIGYNRLVGTGIVLISELKNDELLNEIVKESFDELIERFYMYINASVEYLSDIGVAINSEIKDCLQKIEQITELLESRNMLTTDKLDFNIKVVEKMNSIPGIDEKVQELLEKVLLASQKKVK